MAQRSRGTVGTEDQRNSGHRGPVGTKDQRNSGYRGPGVKRTRGTVRPEE